jgi:hypothetical protein
MRSSSTGLHAMQQIILACPVSILLRATGFRETSNTNIARVDAYAIRFPDGDAAKTFRFQT